MKKFFSALFVVLFASTMMAQTGRTCNDPIPVDSNYVGRVEGPCELWYTASTYDLPLNVHFIPDNTNSEWGPEVMVDFTCVPGVYADSKLDSLLTMVEDFDVSFPLEFLCDLVTSSGKNEWSLSINRSYREQMAEYGITYNVPAYVKVTFFEAGTISLRPDTAFQACMDNTPKIKLGDTISVLPNDENNAYIFSYTDWQEDSIRFVWIGEQPARVFLATTDCEFIPDVDNGFVWRTYDITDGKPRKLYSGQMKEDIKNYKAGGLYYGKIVAPVAGKFVVEKIPMGTAQGGAIVMEKGKAINLEANDTTTLYCFPRTWKGMYFSTTTSSEILMYTSPSYDFGIAQSKGAWRRVFPFDIENGRRALYVSNTEMKVVTDKAIDDYIYVRFVCAAQTTIIAEDWEQSECVGQSTLIRPNASVTVLARSSNTIFRMRYADWEGYDITINWSGNSTLPVYIADACDFTLASNNAHVLQYASVDRKGKFTIPASSVNSWSSRVDEDGFLYVRFNPTNQGAATFATDKPAPIISSCVLGSTLLEPKAELVLNLDKAFDIYRIDYQAWLASGVKLVWTGASPLHTFVAKDCEFAVAIYHKDVVNYTEVPAEGNVILSKDILATLGQYVDEDGYLYIRFLTELEGALTTQLAE